MAVLPQQTPPADPTGKYLDDLLANLGGGATSQHFKELSNEIVLRASTGKISYDEAASLLGYYGRLFPSTLDEDRAKELTRGILGGDDIQARLSRLRGGLPIADERPDPRQQVKDEVRRLANSYGLSPEQRAELGKKLSDALSLSDPDSREYTEDAQRLFDSGDINRMATSVLRKEAMEKFDAAWKDTITQVELYAGTLTGMQKAAWDTIVVGMKGQKDAQAEAYWGQYLNGLDKADAQREWAGSFLTDRDAEASRAQAMAQVREAGAADFLSRRSGLLIANAAPASMRLNALDRKQAEALTQQGADFAVQRTQQNVRLAAQIADRVKVLTDILDAKGKGTELDPTKREALGLMRDALEDATGELQQNYLRYGQYRNLTPEQFVQAEGLSAITRRVDGVGQHVGADILSTISNVLSFVTPAEAASAAADVQAKGVTDAATQLIDAKIRTRQGLLDHPVYRTQAQAEITALTQQRAQIAGAVKANPTATAQQIADSVMSGRPIVPATTATTPALAMAAAPPPATGAPAPGATASTPPPVSVTHGTAVDLDAIAPLQLRASSFGRLASRPDFDLREAEEMYDFYTLNLLGTGWRSFEEFYLKSKKSAQEAAAGRPIPSVAPPPAPEGTPVPTAPSPTAPLPAPGAPATTPEQRAEGEAAAAAAMYAAELDKKRREDELAGKTTGIDTRIPGGKRIPGAPR